MTNEMKEKINNLCLEYGLEMPYGDIGYDEMKKRLAAIGLLDESDDQ